MPSTTGHSDSDSSDQDTRFDPDDPSVDSTGEGSSSNPLSYKPTTSNPDPYSTPPTMNLNHHSKRHSSPPTTPTTPTTPTPTLSHPSYLPSDTDEPPAASAAPASLRRRPRRPLPLSFETSRLSTLLLVVMTFASLGVLAMMVDSWLHHQRDPIGCNQSYMRPSFVRQAGFDSEMTRFAGKYALYLYREKMYDNSDQPTGVPALFIPGHAGSYKQVRSIAAEAAVLYYDQMARELMAVEKGVRGLDFFTVDFNEEFSALHGHSLLEQAEYLNDAIGFILSLYPTTRRAEPRTAKLPDPTSVVIIGHSMGGVVARTMFTMPNYQPGSINTIITMSTPHLLPPAPFDWKISRIYRDIYDFWRHGYSASGASAPAITPQSPVGMGVGAPHTPHHALSLLDVTLVSIAGGNLDNVVCSDTANIESIVPASHGFTMFTTGIPNVWVGSDHPAILWCNQLVKIVAKSLLEVVDARQRGQTKPVEQRMAVFRKAFLSGLEEREPEAVGGNDLISLANLAEINTVLVHTGYRLSLNLDPATVTTPQVHLLPIPRNTKPNTLRLDTFSLLTNQPVGRTQSFDFLLCTAAPNKPEPRPPNSPTGPWELPLAAASKLSCRPISDLVVTVPASTVRDVFPFSGRTFKFLRLREPEWQGNHYVAIVDRGAASSVDGFLVGEYYNEAENTKIIDTPLLDILLHGIHLPRITPRTALLSAVHIPAIHSQLIAYKLRLRRPACSAREAKFTPFVRQVTSSSPAMYESKFHVNVEDDVEVGIAFHGRVPFLERRSGEDVGKKGLLLQVWVDPTCKGPVEAQIKVDWYGSVGRGLMRFTMAFACFPFIIVVMVLRAQLQAYNQCGTFPHFGQGLSYVLRKTLPLFLTLVALCSIYQTTARGGASYSIGDFLSLDPTTSDKISTTASASFSFADVLIGNQDPFFWWLPLVLFVLCLGVAVMLWGFLSALVRTLGFVVAFVGRNGPAVAQLITRYWISSDMRSERSVFWNRFFSNRCNADVDEIRFSDTSRRQESAIRRLQRRAITTMILFVLVATFIPYQFAFVVAFLVHFVSCVRTVAKAMNADDPAKRQRNWDRYHYMQSVLVLLFTLLPFTLPVLVVWIRNLSVQWFAPFSSDHSIFAIAPFMIYVEMLTGGKMLPRTPDVRLRFTTNLILYGIITYAFLYGVRYTHSLYFLSNGFVTWLVILHARESWVTKVAAVYVFEHFFRFQNKKRS